MSVKLISDIARELGDPGDTWSWERWAVTGHDPERLWTCQGVELCGTAGWWLRLAAAPKETFFSKGELRRTKQGPCLHCSLANNEGGAWAQFAPAQATL